MKSTKKKVEVFVYGKHRVSAPAAHLCETTTEFPLWTQLTGADRQLPAVNTLFINTKSQRSPCCRQCMADGSGSWNEIRISKDKLKETPLTVR